MRPRPTCRKRCGEKNSGSTSAAKTRNATNVNNAEVDAEADATLQYLEGQPCVDTNTGQRSSEHCFVLIDSKTWWCPGCGTETTTRPKDEDVL